MSTEPASTDRTAPEQSSPSYTDDDGHLAVASMLTAVNPQDDTTATRRSWADAAADLREWAHLVGSIAAFGLVVVLASCAVVLSVIAIAPLAATAAGSGGLLTTWVAGIGLLLATPHAASRCLAAVRQAT